MTKELDRLTGEILKAEQFLRKLPGAHLKNCFITVDDAIIYLDGKEIIVKYRDNQVRIHDLHIQDQIKYANHIPDLIYIARIGEDRINEMVIDVTDSIEHCIATVTQEIADTYK